MNMDYLDKTKTRCLRGVFALLIVLHHTMQFMENSNSLYPKDMGYLFVSIFYFISGYGLMYSLSKNKQYLNNFFKKRILKLYMPFLLATFIYVFVRSLLGYHYNFKIIILSLVGTSIIVNFSWYIFSILLFYIAFYLSFKFLRGNFPIYAIGIFTILYTGGAYLLHLDVWWFISCFGFILGILWCVFKKNIDDFIRINYPIVFIFTFIVFAITFFNLLSGFSGIIIHSESLVKVIKLFEYIISSMLFCVLTLLVIMKIHTENKILIYLGGLSGEIYVMQGLPIKEMKSNIINIHNNILYLILVICITISLSILLKKLENIVTNLTKQLINFKEISS